MTESEITCFEHERLGKLEVPTASLLRVDGLPGFPELRRLAILEHDRPSLFAWLVSLERLDLAFVVTDPRRIFCDYAPEPNPSDLEALDAQPDDELDVLAIANLAEPGKPTLNLAAPILVNARNQRAVQAILLGDAYHARTALGTSLEEVRRGEVPKASVQIESKPQR